MTRFLFLLVFLTNSISAQLSDPESIPAWNVLGSNYETWSTALLVIDFEDIQSQNSFTVCQTFDFIFTNNSSGKVLLPSGDISVECTITIPSNFVLEGASDASTKLIFNTSTETDLIRAIGSMGNQLVSGTNVLKGTNDFTHPILASSIVAGDLIYIVDTDDSLVVSPWAIGWTGQFVTVESVLNDVISFENAIRRSFQNATIWKVNPVEKVGIKNLAIESTFPTVGQTKNIFFNLARDCFVECVSSLNCNFSHVTLNKSSKITVRNSTFKDAHSYGGGGKGYGVVCQVGTGDCLIENNLFDHLRHSMLLQIGANGNVYGYNYSINPFWTGVSLPSNSAGDMVLHGDYTYMNLFEGNVGQNIVIDDSHGKNGPYNTFFRNRAKLYGIFMNNNPATDSVNFIGNEITNSGFLLGNFVTFGNGHFSYGNNRLGTSVPSNTQTITLNTLYNPTVSDFYTYESNFPPIGYPNTLNQNRSYAEFQGVNGLSLCATYVFNSVSELNSFNEIEIYPNPSKNWVKVVNQKKDISMVRVLNPSGQEVLVVRGNSNEVTFSVSDLPKGFYFVEVIGEKDEVVVEKLMVE